MKAKLIEPVNGVDTLPNGGFVTNMPMMNQAGRFAFRQAQRDRCGARRRMQRVGVTLPPPTVIVRPHLCLLSRANMFWNGVRPRHRRSRNQWTPNGRLVTSLVKWIAVSVWISWSPFLSGVTRGIIVVGRVVLFRGSAMRVLSSEVEMIDCAPWYLSGFVSNDKLGP